MSDFKILRAAEAPDYADDADNPFLGYSGALGAERLGFNLRVLSPGKAHHSPGMDPATGHSHADEIEEIYFVLEGEVTMNIDGEVFTLGPRDAVRIPGPAKRAARNESDTPAVLVMASPKMTDPRGQSEFHPDFWQASE